MQRGVGGGDRKDGYDDDVIASLSRTDCFFTYMLYIHFRSACFL